MSRFFKRFLIVFPIFIFAFFAFSTTAFASTIGRPINNVGLTGYWPLDEGNGLTTMDRSGFGNNGTLTSSPTWVNSKAGLGQALNFVGASSQYVSVATSSGIGTGNFTITGWAYRASTGQHGAFIKIGGASDASGVAIGVSPNDSSGFENSGDTLTVLYENVRWAPTGQNFGTGWHHFALVANSSGQPTVYYDGVKVFSDTGSAPIAPTTAQTEIGGYFSTLPSNRYYTGSLDEIRVYNRALSADEISRLYKLQKPKVASGINNTGLVGYWPMEEGVGTRVEDASFNSLNGTLSGGTWTSGKVGGALSFNGSSDYVNLGDPSSVDFGSGDYTFSTWIYPTSVYDVNGYEILAKDGTAPQGGRQFEFALSPGGVPGVIRSTIFEADNTYTVYDSGNIIATSTWYHLAMVRNGNSPGSFKLYVNGAPTTFTYNAAASGAGGDFPKTMQSTATEFDIGRRIYTAFNGNFPGKIDETRIYNRALSATEVLALYKGSKASVVDKTKTNRITNGLVGYWTFDGKNIYGTNAYDSYISGNTGTLTGGVKPAFGKFSQALSFDGTTGYVSIPNNGFSSLLSGSISAWIYPTAQNDGIISTNTDHTNNRQFPLGVVDSTPGVTFNLSATAVVAAGSVTFVCKTTNAFSYNSWHLVNYTSTNGSGTFNLYVDGVNQAYSCSTGSATNFFYGNAMSGADILQIGAKSDGSTSHGAFYSGRIDEVRIYNRALSADEVKALYNMGK